LTALAFDLPPALEATEPPARRDDVRLLVATRSDGAVAHHRFRDLPGILRPGDLLVVNTSATLPASIAARRRDGTPIRLHASTRLDGDGPRQLWLIELRSADGTRPRGDGRAGEVLALDGGGTAELLAPYAGEDRLWLARVETPGGDLVAHLQRHGAPIRYGYVPRPWPLDAYQNVYALQPGSAEMPSAGRPFSAELITRLAASGVHVAPIVLHTGVSSPERHEAPYAEPFTVPEATARLVNAVHYWGGRVVAVGTTVVRALESAAAEDGTVEAQEGWTELVITPDRGLRAVDGLLTGWHEPQASHLQMLEAAAGPELLERSYAEALDHGYRWHEFGDSHLVLP
jgi:S-adenosylmethionine:tRNA ribosyltransferase-isomerase